MDGGRYAPQQSGWDNGNVLESCDDVHDSGLRARAAYEGRGGYVEGGFGRESGFVRESYPRGVFYDREIYGVAPAVLGLWPPARRRTIEDELALLREVQRQEKAGLADPLREYGHERAARPSRGRDSYDNDDSDYKRRPLLGGREGSRDVDLEFPHRYRGYDSDRERGYRDRDWQRRRERFLDRSRSRDRDRARDRDWSPHDRDRQHNWDRDWDRSGSVSYDERSRRSRSRSRRSRSRGWRENSTEEVSRHETLRSDRRRDREGRSNHHDRATLAPSATLVVKGLSQKTVEHDLYHALADWGPLRHVRVIKERNSGISRGFAFVDFPSMEAAQKMMDGAGYDGLVVDGRRLFFEYSSKPTGGTAISEGGSSSRGPSSKNISGTGSDWMCTVCGCVNFARRTVCFQCNEGRAEDAPAADVPTSTAPMSGGKKGFEPGPTHVLVVRGLDENVNEEALHYEFSKHANIKDLRLVRDKFTQVSRGFGFIHFNSVEDASKALEASNGSSLEKNGQILRVAFAKSIYGPGSSSANPNLPQGTVAAATAAIEAAAFAQQYDKAGWAPKEYKPGRDVNYTSGAPDQAVQGKAGNNWNKGGEKALVYDPGCSKEGPSFPTRSSTHEARTSEGNEAPQSGFLWDEASGYYYDAASGFYYDGHRELYYDSNTGIWYTYDQDTQQYAQFVDPSTEQASEAGTDLARSTTERAGESAVDASVTSRAVISAPAAVSLELVEKKLTLAEAVAAAAMAAQVAAKKEKERIKDKEKDNRLAGKGPVMVSKRKISNAMNQWKQRQSESLTIQGPVTRASPISIASSVELPSDTNASIAASDGATCQMSTSRGRGACVVKDTPISAGGRTAENPYGRIIRVSEGRGRAKSHVTASSPFNSNLRVTSTGATLASLSAPVGQELRSAGRGTTRASTANSGSSFTNPSVDPGTTTPFRTDASALGSYGPLAGTKRRFTETPQTGYRDRAAERRNLYGSSVSGDNALDSDLKEKGLGNKGRGLDMPFPPGVGVKSDANGALGGPEVQSFEIISAEKALDETNVGNRMLRNMGWQEGSGLGREGTGIVEPVQAQGTGEKAGLGSAAQRKVGTRFETQPGDTYRIVIQKKALARFHDIM